MGNPLRDMIINEIVKPEIRTANRTYLGRIDNYYPELRTADLTINNLDATPDMSEKQLNVPIAYGAALASGDDIQIGYRAVVTYVGAETSNPVIIAVIKDGVYNNSTGQQYIPSDFSQHDDVYNAIKKLIPDSVESVVKKLLPDAVEGAVTTAVKDVAYVADRTKDLFTNGLNKFTDMFK